MLTKRPEGFYIIIPIVFLTLGAASLINLICDLINKYKTIKSIGSNEFVLIEASVKDIYAEDDHEDGPNGPGEGYNSYTTLKYLYNENAKNVKIKISNMAEWKVLKNQQIHLAFCTAKGEITLEPFMLILGNSYIIDPEIKVLYQKNIISP